MERICLNTGTDSQGMRLDVYLCGKLDNFTRSAIQRLMEQCMVVVMGKTVKKNYILQGGEEIIVTLPQAKEAAAAAEKIPLNIVYEDSSLIVIDKPRGMVVHPAPGNGGGTLVNGLLAHCGDSLSGIGGVLRPGIVHRLDKDTSGLLVVAKNDSAHRHLSAQLKDRSLSRLYQAVVRGALKENEGIIQAPIGRCPKNRKKMAVVPGGREAETTWRVLGGYPGYTHVECRLKTGRTHQIRVHLAYIGHPVAGDSLYGGREAHGLEGQCLHAWHIGFIHPETEKAMVFDSPLPGYFVDFLTRLEG